VLCVVAGYFLLGCGANLTIKLPNGHYVVVANANDVAINSASGDTVTKWSVGKLSHEGDYVFGTIVDPDTQSLQEYFVLDTRAGVTSYYPNEPAWAAALSTVSITNRDLRGPSAFYNMADQVWWRVAILMLILLAVSVPIWLWRRSSKNSAELHEMRGQPGL
jgi:hypothetical protein